MRYRKNKDKMNFEPETKLEYIWIDIELNSDQILFGANIINSYTVKSKAIESSSTDYLVV